MSDHPLTFHGPGWHGEERTPVVDGKYYDRATGEVCSVPDSGHQEYLGPPAVDIIISSLHEDSCNAKYRAARPLPMEVLLCHIMKVVEEKKLQLDSVSATPYAIRVMVAHELTVEEFSDISIHTAQGV